MPFRRRWERLKCGVHHFLTRATNYFTVRLREIGTGISEASKRVPFFPFATQGGKQANS